MCAGVCGQGSFAAEKGRDVRVLVHKAGCVVDLVVDDDVEILLGAVLRDVGVGEFLGGHGEEMWMEICVVE